MKRKYKSDDDWTALDFSNEWKSLFPANSIHNGPLLRSSPSTFGPLIFNPVPGTVTLLISSPLISPLLEFTTAARLSLARFVTTSTNPTSFLPPSLACSLAGVASAEDYGADVEFQLRNNRLQVLNCPVSESVIVFVPIGENFDQVGYLSLVVEDGKMSGSGLSGADGAVFPFVDRKKFGHKIVKMLVNPIEEGLVTVDSGVLEGCIGTLIVCTLYSVHWFGVKVLNDGKPCLVYFCGKQFKSSRVVDAAWSPYMPEESAVILESGEIFMFDLNRIEKNGKPNGKCKGRRFTTLCKGLGVLEKHKWFGCEFSWHPQILFVGHEEAIFLLDLRSEEKVVSCLARIESLAVNTQLSGKDMFISLARAGFDGFQVVVTSKRVLTILDTRKPLAPVLQWDHNLDNPTYIEVQRLSDLRSGLSEDSFVWATESGSCIILGSFWHNEFSIFCYGPCEPTSKGSVVSKIAEICTAIYAWELPSDIILTGSDCRCGSCLICNEFVKDALPKWATWQQKKEITLGFGMINTNISSLLWESHKNGGFTLVRLLSSGKLESQRYSASWKLSNALCTSHEASLKNIGDSLIFSAGQDKYKFPRRFKYSKLDYLSAYLNSDLNGHLLSKQIRPLGRHLKTELRDVEMMLKSFGLGSPVSNTDVLEDVSFPSSVHEVAVRRTWAELPTSLLKLAFSNYSELLDVRVDKKESALEFLPVPNEPQLPPFFNRKCSKRSNKWSVKVNRSTDSVGPLLPLPILVLLHKSSICSSDKFSYDCELANRGCELKEVAKESAVTILSNGKEDTTYHSQNSLDPSTLRFVMYARGPTTEAPHYYTSYCEQDGNGSRDDQYGTYISKLDNNSRGTMKDAEDKHFNDLCPVDLKFQGRVLIGKEGQRGFSLIKRQLSSFIAGIDSYQEICRSSKYQKK